MSVQRLPQEAIKQISSAQVINSVSSVVKELLENALDAGATVVDIKLERNGLDKVEVRDNGVGISTTNINYVCLPHCTSKIRNFDDLEHLQSYGFRGEALHSLCAVSQLSITTKTVHDQVASTYIFDRNGIVGDVKPSHQMNGTVILATNLFKNVPVRRQFYESTRKASEELKKIEKIVKHLSIVHTKLRVTLAHNKCLIWHKTSVCSLRQSLMQVYPSAVLKNLKDVFCSFENISIEMFIANRDCNLPVLLQPINEAILLYINQRLVKDNKIEKVIFEEMNHLYGSTLPANKCPLTFLSLRLSPESLDVNLEPNKTKIFIENHEEILMKVRETIMRHFYEQSATDDLKSLLLEKDELQNPSKKFKLSPVSANLDVSKMRNIIIEKVNVGGETTALELGSVNLSVLGEPATSRDDTLNLKENDSCVSANRNLDPVADISDMKLSISSDVLCYDDSYDKPPSSPLFHVTPFNKYERVEVGPSYFPNENSFETSSTSAETKNTLAVVFNPVDKDSEQLRSNNDEPLPVLFDDSCFEDKNNSNLSDENVTPSQWSKGLVTITDEPLKGGVILFDGSNNTDRAKITKKEFGKKSERNGGFECKDLNRSVSSQIGRKDMAGFTNFARQIRSEIIRENPGVSFTHVAKELASRWGKLHNDEKTTYAEDSIRMKRKASSDCKPKATFKRKTLALTVSMNVIVEKLKIPGRLRRRVNGNLITLIGVLEKDEKWLYKLDDDVSIVDVNHLQENVLLHRYTCNWSVPVKQLDQPIEISSRIIGENLWNFLSTLDQAHDSNDESVSFISDCRITKNGFKVIIHRGHGDSLKLSITEVAKDMDGNAIADFIETLQLALQFEELEHCRSEAIKKKLLEEVMRACEQKTVPKEAAEVRMLLQYWMQCMFRRKICPHDEPISVDLHKL